MTDRAYRRRNVINKTDDSSYEVDDSTSTNQTHFMAFDHIPPGLLTRLQERWQNNRLWWLGNRVAELRYWLWKLIK